MSSFLSQDDYKVKLQNRHLQQIIEDDATVLDVAEETAIQVVKDALHARYNIENIFSQSGSNRAANVVRWCTCLVVYYIYERIPDKLIPERVVDEYERTLETLELISDAKQSVDLPRKVDAENEVLTKFRWGSNSKRQHS